jgi:hypothetical protein
MAQRTTYSHDRPSHPEELAQLGKWLERLKNGDDLRQHMVRRVRRAICRDEYENLLKLEIAVDRIADELKPG